MNNEGGVTSVFKKQNEQTNNNLTDTKSEGKLEEIRQISVTQFQYDLPNIKTFLKLPIYVALTVEVNHFSNFYFRGLWSCSEQRSRIVYFFMNVHS